MLCYQCFGHCRSVTWANPPFFNLLAIGVVGRWVLALRNYRVLRPSIEVKVTFRIILNNINMYFFSFITCLKKYSHFKDQTLRNILILNLLKSEEQNKRSSPYLHPCLSNWEGRYWWRRWSTSSRFKAYSRHIVVILGKKILRHFTLLGCTSKQF